MEMVGQAIWEAWIPEFYPVESLRHPGFFKKELHSVHSLYWSQILQTHPAVSMESWKGG